jgi:hypothetical protein
VQPLHNRYLDTIPPSIMRSTRTARRSLAQYATPWVKDTPSQKEIMHLLAGREGLSYDNTLVEERGGSIIRATLTPSLGTYG